jgi:hypothetical protein
MENEAELQARIFLLEERLREMNDWLNRYPEPGTYGCTNQMILNKQLLES